MNDLVEIIYKGSSCDDPSHLTSLYDAFEEKNSKDFNTEDSLERVKWIKGSFTWIPIPKHYLTRFQKSSEISSSLRGLGNTELTILKSLRCYNLSIAFAPLDSPELALGLEKRADLLVRLDEPELAQVDIESVSRCISYPKKSAHRLINIQKRCTALAYNKLNKPNKSYHAQNKFFTLSNVNPNINNISLSTTIDYNKQCGRKIIATKNINPGEVVMIDEPYCLILEKMLNWDMEHCTNCSKPVLAGIPCNLCTFGWFCSKLCFEEGNRGMHKYEHNYLSYLKSSNILTLKGLLSGRIIFKVGPEELYRIFQTKDPLYNLKSEDSKRNGYDGKGVYNVKSYLPIYHLISHPDVNVLKSKSNAFKAVTLCNLIESTTDFFTRFKHNEDYEEFKDFTSSVILRHMESIEYNAITLSELGVKGEVIRYGAGVYPVLCLINHSCDPNSVPVRSLRFLKTAVVAMKMISVGDEITFSYAPHFTQSQLNDRKTFLKDKYNFNCNCEACNNSWGPLTYNHHVQESQCNQCGKYLLTGKCPKCTLKDYNLSKDLSSFINKLEHIHNMETSIKSLLFFTNPNVFDNNYIHTIQSINRFKHILVQFVNS